MRTGIVIAGVAGAALLATGVGAMLANSSEEVSTEALTVNEPVKAAQARPAPVDCRIVATNETGFDPATTPYPVRADAGNKQVLKGTAVGAAVGAVAGEVIGDKAGYGAAAGAAAGAAGGQAIKADKQQSADERYEAQMAAYQQQKAAYEVALSECQSKRS